MNSSNEDDLAPIAIAARFFVPPKPSCRKPLHRMIDDDDDVPPPARTTNRYSSSPKINHSDFDDSENSDDFDESSSRCEDCEDEADAASESLDSPRVTQRLYPSLGGLEGSRMRKLPKSPQESSLPENTKPKTPKTPINVTYCVTNCQTFEKTKRVSPGFFLSENMPSPRRNSLPPSEKTPQKRSISKVKQTRESFVPRICGWCFLCVVVIVGGLWFGGLVTVDTAAPFIKPTTPMSELDRLTNFQNALKAIRKKFPGQNNRTWMQIKAGMSDVIKRPEKPWMFVLFSNEPAELSCLAEMLGKASSTALLTKGSLSLTANKMGNDYGNTIDELRPLIKESKAVVVHNLLNVDPGAIQAFHTMCDRYNPLVEGAVYIMTIVTKNYVPGSETPEKFVENQLTNRFINKVPEDKLQPLITRLMDGSVIHVTPEVGLTGCSS